MPAIMSQAAALAMVASKSLARRRLRPSQAKVRSTTQRRGRTSKLVMPSLRLTISSVHWPIFCDALPSFGPAQAPSAKTWRRQGKVHRIEASNGGAPSRSWMWAA